MEDEQDTSLKEVAEAVAEKDCKTLQLQEHQKEQPGKSQTIYECQGFD
jgi:hypothetical protein